MRKDDFERNTFCRDCGDEFNSEDANHQSTTSYDEDECSCCCCCGCCNNEESETANNESVPRFELTRSAEERKKELLSNLSIVRTNQEPASVHHLLQFVEALTHSHDFLRQYNLQEDFCLECLLSETSGECCSDGVANLSIRDSPDPNCEVCNESETIPRQTSSHYDCSDCASSPKELTSRRQRVGNRRDRRRRRRHREFQNRRTHTSPQDLERCDQSKVNCKKYDQNFQCCNSDFAEGQQKICNDSGGDISQHVSFPRFQNSGNCNSDCSECQQDGSQSSCSRYFRCEKSSSYKNLASDKPDSSHQGKNSKDISDAYFSRDRPVSPSHHAGCTECLKHEESVPKHLCSPNMRTAHNLDGNFNECECESASGQETLSEKRKLGEFSGYNNTSCRCEGCELENRRSHSLSSECENCEKENFSIKDSSESCSCEAECEDSLMSQTNGNTDCECCAHSSSGQQTSGEEDCEVVSKRQKPSKNSFSYEHLPSSTDFSDDCNCEVCRAESCSEESCDECDFHPSRNKNP